MAPGTQGGGGDGIKWGRGSACQWGAPTTPLGTDTGSPQLPAVFCWGCGEHVLRAIVLGPGLAVAALQSAPQPISPDCVRPGPLKLENRAAQ